MDALKAMWHQFLKDFDKLPGWAPLFVVTLLAVDWAAPPDHISPFGKAILVSREFLAGALTLLLYTVGDAIDEVVFKAGPEGARNTREIYKKRYSTELQAASVHLGVGSGLYSVALKLVTAGEKHHSKFVIHFPNEAAKCLRALILPLAVIAVAFFRQGRTSVALILLATASALLFVYPFVKVLHIRLLYSAASGLAQKNLYHDELLGTMRCVFWDGKFVDSGYSAQRSQTPNNPKSQSPMEKLPNTPLLPTAEKRGG